MDKFKLLKFFTISLISYNLYDITYRLYLALTNNELSSQKLITTAVLGAIEIVILIKFILLRIHTPSKKALLFLGFAHLTLVLIVIDLLLQTPLVLTREAIISIGLIAFGSLTYKKVNLNYYYEQLEVDISLHLRH